MSVSFRLFRPLLTAAVLLLCADRSGAAEKELPLPKLGSRIVCPGEYRGHLQGLATDGKAVYWVFSRDIVKTDFEGRLLAKRAMPNHCGDPCWSAGRLYVPLARGSFNRAPENGRPSRNYVVVFDPELREIARHHVPEMIYGAGGIAEHGGHFFIVGGRPAGRPGNTVMEYDRDFRFIRSHEADFDSAKGIQTVNRAFGKWYFGCYGTGGTTVEAGDDFRVTRRLRPNSSVGMIPLPDGRVLVGQLAGGSAGKRTGAEARVVRLTVAETTPPPGGRR